MLFRSLENLNEKRKIAEAPQSLVLQLKYVQNFPNNQKVALYYAPTIKQFFSFVYNKGALYEDCSIIEKLIGIDDIETVEFTDGSSLNINKECAENILDIYNILEDQKEEFEQYISSSEENFLSALQYSVNNKNKE